MYGLPANQCSPSSVEKKEVELKKNMAIVEKDKLKIEETIAELDRYKREALEKTWEKVTTYVPAFLCSNSGSLSSVTLAASSRNSFRATLPSW